MKNTKIIIYKDPQIEDKKIATVEIIEKVGKTLPFQLVEVSTKKDITWICEKFRCKVVESNCDYLKEGDIRVFKKRKILGYGIQHTKGYVKDKETEELEDIIFDSFLKVDGIEIY